MLPHKGTGLRVLARDANTPPRGGSMKTLLLGAVGMLVLQVLLYACIGDRPPRCP